MDRKLLTELGYGDPQRKDSTSLVTAPKTAAASFYFSWTLLPLTKKVGYQEGSWQVGAIVFLLGPRKEISRLPKISRLHRQVLTVQFFTKATLSAQMDEYDYEVGKGYQSLFHHLDQLTR